jgi:hypothetical protein
MFVDDDSIISYKENKRERNNKVKTKLIDDSERGIENMVYINVRVRHNSITSIKSDRNCKDDYNKNFEKVVYRDESRSVCSETPPRISNNRTPPPCFSPHITTIKFHLILLHFKFCVANVHSCQYGIVQAYCFI